MVCCEFVVDFILFLVSCFLMEKYCKTKISCFCNNQKYIPVLKSLFISLYGHLVLSIRYYLL